MQELGVTSKRSQVWKLGDDRSADQAVLAAIPRRRQCPCVHTRFLHHHQPETPEDFLSRPRSCATISSKRCRLCFDLASYCARARQASSAQYSLANPRTSWCYALFEAEHWLWRSSKLSQTLESDPQFSHPPGQYSYWSSSGVRPPQALKLLPTALYQLSPPPRLPLARAKRAFPTFTLHRTNTPET